MTALATTAPRFTQAEAIARAVERIRQDGIQESRQLHHKRKKLIDQFKASPALFFASIHPSLSTQEAVEDANHEIALIRNMPTHRRANAQGRLVRAKHKRLYGRFFRRFGQRVWAQEAA